MLVKLKLRFAPVRLSAWLTDCNYTHVLNRGAGGVRSPLDRAGRGAGSGDHFGVIAVARQQGCRMPTYDRQLGKAATSACHATASITQPSHAAKCWRPARTMGWPKATHNPRARG